MVTSETLLFPDSDYDFLSALRTALIYSERVRVLTVYDREFADDLLRTRKRVRKRGVDFEDWMVKYAKFVRYAAPYLEMLEDEGALEPIALGLIHRREEFDGLVSDFAPFQQHLEGIVQVIRNQPAQSRDSFLALLRRCTYKCPPSLHNIIFSS